MPRVVHFEIHADDPSRALQFYEKVYGWDFKKWDGPHDYWLVTTGPKDQPGINGGLLRRRGAVTGDSVIAYVCTVDVPSVDTFVEKVRDSGGSIALEKMPIPSVG